MAGPGAGIMFCNKVNFANLTNHTITDNGAGSGNGASEYHLNTDGTARSSTNWSGNSTFASEWLTGGDVGSFTATVTNSGTGLTSGSSALSTALNLGTGRYWANTSATAATLTSTLTVTIKDAYNGLTLATATITLSSTGDSTIHTCVTYDSYLSTLMQARNVLVGDRFTTVDRGEFMQRPVLKVSDLVLQECVRIETACGAVLRCSVTTPFELRADIRQSRMCLAPNIEGHDVMVDVDNVPRWDKVISVTRIGQCFVVPIDFGGYSFAAGDDAHKRIYSHNKTIP
jgi:hypothetical protein